MLVRRRGVRRSFFPLESSTWMSARQQRCSSERELRPSSGLFLVYTWLRGIRKKSSLPGEARSTLQSRTFSPNGTFARLVKCTFSPVAVGISSVSRAALSSNFFLPLSRSCSLSRFFRDVPMPLNRVKSLLSPVADENKYALCKKHSSKMAKYVSGSVWINAR